MYSPRTLAHWFFAISGCIISSAVWALTAPPGDLVGLPWPQIFIGVMLALWGGITRTAERALEASKAAHDNPPGTFDLRGELFKDLIVSSGIGFLIFAVGSWQEWGVWLLGSALWLAGYLGTRLLAGLGEAALDYLQRRAGGPPTPPYSAPPIPDGFDCPDTQPTSPGALDTLPAKPQ